MKKIKRFSAVFSLFLLLPASITWAQTITSIKGLTTAKFNLPQGVINIYLPENIANSNQVTIGFKVDPAGNNEKQRNKSLNELLKSEVRVGDPVNPRQALLAQYYNAATHSGLLPPIIISSAFAVSLTNSKKQTQVVPIEIKQIKQTAAQQGTGCSIPSHALAGSPLKLAGPFDGDAFNTKCLLDNKPLVILAESSGKCFVVYPAEANGIKTMQVTENENPLCSQPVSSVQMNITTGKLSLLKGENTYLDVTITGLQNLPDTAFLTLANLSADVVAMLPLNDILIVLPPNSVSSGTFNKRFDIQSIRSGSFLVNVNLDLPDVEDNPPTQPEPNHPPTTTQPKCECHADCSILVFKTSKEEAYFGVSLDAECRGNCYVDKTTYKWHIGESGKDVAEIDGVDFDKFVTVKLKKRGNYTIYLNGTVTCSDGSQCEFHCSLEQTVPGNPTTGVPTCTLDTALLVGPKMDGNLKKGFAGIKKIKRDEFIVLGAEGLDYDQLKWICIPSTECDDNPPSHKTILLNSRVKFKWECKEGEGSFLKLGCLPLDHLTDSGDYVIYKPPYLELPTIEKDTSKTVTVTLSIIDDNPTQPRDDTMYHTITIIIHRNTDIPDEYTLQIDRDKYEEPKKDLPPDVEFVCNTEGPNWAVDKGLVTPIIELPEVGDNDKMVTGEWIILKAKDQRDMDEVTVSCFSSKCKPPKPLKIKLEDNVAWEWQPVIEGGHYIDVEPTSTVTGQYVIYEAPKDFDKSKKVLEVNIKVKVKNPDGSKIMDEGKEGTIKLKIYRGGIKLSTPPIAWLPEENNSVELTSSLVYKDAGAWKPGLEHMGRIHFFELVSVSEEKGICMNYPPPTEANECRDLILNNEKGVEAFNDQTDPKKCTLKEQYLQARTKEPVKDYTITVHSQDYGSYGFLRSFANVYKVEKEKVTIDGSVVYSQIPLTDDDVKHPLHRLLKKSSDNRVSIPQDIDGNHIPDNGWVADDGEKMIDPVDVKADNDKLPEGDRFNGDGLTAYEEYRGFKILSTVEPKEILETESGAAKVKKKPDPKHIRTNYNKKDIFISNKEDLPLWMYAKVTKLSVHEINESQFVNVKTRVINPNFNVTTHLVDQKGLYLMTSIYDATLHGKCWTPSKVPAPPNWVDSVVIYTDNVKKDCDTRKLNYDLKIAAVVAHELCHGINVCHHGESDPDKNADSYDKEHGLRSGDTRCVMRYDNMGVRVVPGFSPEAIGSILCETKNGTGYNIQIIKKNNRLQQVDAVFGEAAFNRGDCIHQFRVSGREPQPGPCGNRLLSKK